MAFALMASLATACAGGGHTAAIPPAGTTGAASAPSAGKATTQAARHVFYSRSYLQQHPELKHQPSGAQRATSASGSGNLLYHGGSIQKTPTVYLIFWGFSGPNDGAHDPNGMASYLTSFFNAVGGSAWINSDTQYTSSSQGAITNPSQQLAGTWYDSSQPPSTYAQGDVANEALRGVAHFGYNVDANYFVVTPHGVTTSGFGTQFCAYHSSTNSGSGPIAYTDLPYIPDAGSNCGQGYVNSPGTLDGATIVAGHEEAETQTDPFPSSGWVDTTGAENGDKCAWVGLANTQLNGGTFPTQPLWSNASSSCVQAYGSPPPPPSSGDLYAVVRAGTGSGMTEVHALNGSNFSSFTKHVATALGPTGSGADWQFLVGPYRNDGQPDLWAIAKANTGSGMTEVHILSAATNYSTFLLHAATALQATGSDQTWQFGLGDYNHDGNLDLFSIVRQNTGSGMTEVHVLDGTNFGSFLTHVATGLGPTGGDGSWKFLVGPYNRDGAPDVWAIAKANTGSGTTEVHILSAASNYAAFALHSSSSLPVSGSDGGWDFALHDYNGDGAVDLYGIKKANTGSNSTEVFVLDGTNFNSRLVGIGTPLQPTGTDLTWEFGESS